MTNIKSNDTRITELETAVANLQKESTANTELLKQIVTKLDKPAAGIGGINLETLLNYKLSMKFVDGI